MNVTLEEAEADMARLEAVLKTARHDFPAADCELCEERRARGWKPCERCMALLRADSGETLCQFCRLHRCPGLVG